MPSKKQTPDKEIKFNGNLDSVYKILKKFVKDKCVGADFDMLSEKETINILKTWWNKNKFKFKNNINEFY